VTLLSREQIEKILSPLPKKRRIAVVRPGALGDVIMISNCFPKLREQFDEIHLFCHESVVDILSPFLLTYNLVDKMESYELLRESDYDKVVNCIGYPINQEGYLDAKMKKHLIFYFADELGVEVSLDEVALAPLPPRQVLKEPYITIQVKPGWSVYREWWGWQDLVAKLKCSEPEVGIYQIGGPDDPALLDIDGSFLGRTFEDNLYAQCWSKVHVGVDSVFSHTGNYLWEGTGKKNSVILWGATQYDATGYEHNTNICLNLPCQPCFRENPWMSPVPQTRCPNPPEQTYQDPKHECMAGITVDMVYDATLKLLNRRDN